MTAYEKDWQIGLAALRPSQKDLEHGLELHRNSFVFDTYGFIPTGGGKFPRLDELVRGGASRDEVRYAVENFRMYESLKDPLMQKKLAETWEFAGVDCVFQNSGEESNDIEMLLKRLSSYTGAVDMLDLYERAVFPDQFAGIRERGHKAVYMTTNGVPLPSRLVSAEESLIYIEIFFKLGIRMMHMTYNRRNLLGSGCAEPNDAGLSDLGRLAVREMNRLGIIPDVAHSGHLTSLETALCSEKPVVSSHAVTGKLSTHFRAKNDEVISALKKTNGLIGICAYPPFIQGDMTINAFIDHVDYVARTFGVDHVGIGTDRGTWLAPVEFEESVPKSRAIFENFWNGTTLSGIATEEQFSQIAWTNWPLFTVALVMRGYKDDEIRKIIGGNVLRVLKESAV